MGSRVLSKLQDVAIDVVNDHLRDPNKTINSPTPSSSASVIGTQIAAEMAPTVAFLSNNEPWYQSWVTVGSLVPILSGIFGEIALIQARNWDAQAHATCIAGIIGGCTALYGRWVARKPIGA